MQIADFDYNLPTPLIAQHPLDDRSASRMLVVDRTLGTYTDGTFAEFADRLRPDDLLVVNNTRVFPARLNGTSDTGGKVEIFLVKRVAGNEWEALARPAKRLRPGKKIDFGVTLHGTIVDRHDDGKVTVRFDGDDVDSLIDEVGSTPLPPYIKRNGGDPRFDRERYQTIYARERGAIAAPTAGLHFTSRTFDDLRTKGVEVAEITLHVGYGTFEPVRAEDLGTHRVQPEQYELDTPAAARLNAAHDSGRRIVAVGTTSVRALESNFGISGRFMPSVGMAEITITPGYTFRAVDAMLTNFHLPKSSLLVLTSTFGGHELIMNAYRHAVEAGYRFYSYGDCMLIV